MKVYNTKFSLYKRTGWFSKDCEDILRVLSNAGLAIVDVKELEKIKEMESMYDDGK